MSKRKAARELAKALADLRESIELVSGVLDGSVYVAAYCGEHRVSHWHEVLVDV